MILHTKGNLIRNGYCPEGFPDGDWKKEHVEANGSQPLSIVESHNYSRHDKKIRDEYRDYFGGNGNMNQKHQSLLIKDKYEAKFIILSSLPIIRFIGT